MRKKLLIILATAVFAAVAVYFIYTSPRQAQADSLCSHIIFSFEQNGERQELKCFKYDDKLCYVFIPTFCSADCLSASADAEGLSLDGNEISSSTPCDFLSSGGKYVLSADGYEDMTLETLRLDDGLPSMFIETESKSTEMIHKDKDYRENVSITLLDSSGAVDYKTAGGDTIKGRGNTTWGSPKKPYAITLFEQADLLGMGSAQNWALSSNYLDKTNLRNKIVYDYAKALSAGNDSFSPDCRFVELYLNGSYNGLYLLSEKPELAPNRVEAGDGSLLVCLDAEARKESMFQPFSVVDGVVAEVSSPDSPSKEQLSFIENTLGEVQEAIEADDGICKATGKGWLDYIDLDSWARKYLIEEIFQNFDAGTQSQYYYYNSADSKLYAGPCWDYDNSAGLTVKIPNCFWARRERRSIDTAVPFYSSLWEKEEFRSRVIELYKSEFLPQLNILLDETLPAAANELSPAARADSIRWKYEDAAVQSVTYMQSYLKEHADFLSSAWLDNTDYVTITLKTSYLINCYCVERGENAAELPDPSFFEIAGNYKWYYEDTHEEFDKTQPVTGDIRLVSGEVSRMTSRRNVYAAYLSVIGIGVIFLALLLVDIIRRKKERGKRDEQ